MAAPCERFRRAQKCCNALDDHPLLALGEFWVDRQCEHLCAGRLRHGKSAVRISQIRKSGLHVKRRRVIDLCGDALLLEGRAQFVATLGSNHELVVDVNATAWHRRKADCIAKAEFSEERSVAVRIALARGSPLS